MKYLLLYFQTESWQSGRMRRSWKPLSRKAPGVRIPYSPPERLFLQPQVRKSLNLTPQVIPTETAAF